MNTIIRTVLSHRCAYLLSLVVLALSVFLGTAPCAAQTADAQDPSNISGGEASSDAAPFEGVSDDQHQAHYEEQVGDVVVQGILEGQLTQNGGKLLEAVGKKPGQITFRAEFDAGDETFGCDYEGFPAKMERQWEEPRQQVKQMKEQQGGGR